jgi:threonine dehydrogenase-like Zn-dependent dehydrogenase
MTSRASRAQGERVVVEGIISCGDCDECRIGATNRCTTYDEIGFTRPGALADRIAVPKRLVHRLNETVNVDDAVLIEPMSVVWRALTRFPLRENLNVVVVGDGTIALLAAHLVRRFNPARVVVVGRRAAQASLGEGRGRRRVRDRRSRRSLRPRHRSRRHGTRPPRARSLSPLAARW